MSLIKTSLLSLIATGIKVLTGLVILKVVALYLGPAGIAQLGQFSTLINILAVIAGGGIGLGVIKYVAEYAAIKAPQKLQMFLKSSLAYTLCFSLLTAIITLAFHRYFSIWVLGSAKYADLIMYTAISQIFMAINLLLMAILNGFKQIGRMTLISVLSSLFKLALIVILLRLYGVAGAFIGLISSQALVLFISLTLVFRQHWFRYLFSLQVQWRHVRNLSHYSLMNIISTLIVPVSQIIVRQDLSHLFSWKSVGYWQAIISVGDAYLMAVTFALTAYYLPRLSEISDLRSIKKEIFNGYKIIMPCVLISLLLVYVLRDFVLLVLYNDLFLRARDLFFYQLLGDFFRIGGWLFTYLLLAKMRTKVYICTEVIVGVVFVALSHYMARKFGLIGVTYSFSLTYFLYWILMVSIGISYFRKESRCATTNSP